MRRIGSSTRKRAKERLCATHDSPNLCRRFFYFKALFSYDFIFTVSRGARFVAFPQKNHRYGGFSFGAVTGIRTRDLHLTKMPSYTQKPQYIVIVLFNLHYIWYVFKFRVPMRVPLRQN